ncbi:MAG: enoyl-CoA hydratase/isomerase family protein [Minwuia sp.]|uniref:enoyl-CoA hydratase/isomerase family protein n=1 Tax=Minwuia sp. TaxID=2493630 RepID=UPI003A844C72
MALVERHDDNGLCILTLNRPEALNALSPKLVMELRDHVDALHRQTDEIGVVILRAEGRSFCAGNDLKAIQSGEEAPTPNYQSDTVDLIERLPQPVIGAVQGHCYTGGLELALSVDLIVAGSSAKFADTHGKWGMTPRWGMSRRLPDRVGVQRAKEMMYSGRVVGAEEAVKIGLAVETVPDEQLQDHVIAMARTFLANSWHTLRGDKMLVNEGQNRGHADALTFERAHSPGRSPDVAERVKNFGKG